MSTITLAALTDIHAGDDRPRALLLLREAVERINREIRPDVTVVLGDIIGDGEGPQALYLYQQVADILGGLASPLICIPGNHDSEARCYQALPRPAATVEISGVRFLPFLDIQEPEFNARRTATDLQRITAARAGFSGPIVALQHVPLLPPEAGASPYRLLNAEEVMRDAVEGRLTLAISGHFHQGEPLIHCQGMAFLVVPTFCDPPFPFMAVTLNGDEIVTAPCSMA